MTSAERLARDLWWPHHPSGKRETALRELDEGSVGAVTLEFADFVDMVRFVLERDDYTRASTK